MVKIDYDQSLFNIDEQRTSERYNQVINEVESIIKEVRVSMYRIFLGPTSQKRALYLLAATLLMNFVFEFKNIYTILFFETLVLFIIGIACSELFSYEVRIKFREDLKKFKEKYKDLANN